MKMRRVLLYGGLALGAALFWVGCRCEITVSHKNKAREQISSAKGRLPHEKLLDQAKKAEKDGHPARALGLTLQGLTDWTKRAGYDSARAQRYARLLDEVIANGGLKSYLEFCSQPGSQAGRIVCSKSAATHLHSTADDGKPAPSAIALYQAVCLSSQSSAMSSACGAVPTAVASDPSVLPKLRARLAQGCLTRPMDGDLAQMCESAALAAWVVGMQHWDVTLLGEAGRALMAQDRATGIAMALRLLSQGGPIPQKAVTLVEKLLLGVLGSADGLADLQVAFFQRFGPAQQRAVAAWAAKRLAGKEQQVAAVLDVLDAKASDKLLTGFSRLPKLRPIVAKVRPLLGHSMVRGAVEDYLRTGRGGRAGRARALDYLRSHPSYFESRVIGQVATLPKPARKRLMSLIAEIRPEARFGSISGMVMRKGIKSKQCRVFLSRMSECAYAPGGRAPARRTLKIGVRFVKLRKGVYSTMTTSNGGFFMRRLPVGPYRFWVWCADMKQARPLWEIAFDRKSRKILSVRCPAIVQPERESQMRPLQVDWVPEDEAKTTGSLEDIVAPVPRGAYHPSSHRRK